MRILVLFSNQLFPVDWLKGELKKYDVQKVVTIEDPVFFGDRKGAPGVQYLRLNKLRLAYQHRIFREYVDELSKQLHIPVLVHTIEQTWGLGNTRKVYQKYGHPYQVVMFNPMDHLLMKRLKRAQWHMTVVDTPSFIMTADDLKHYDGALRHAAFFEYVKSKVHILENQKSLDLENRNPFPKDGVHIPSPYVATIRKGGASWATSINWVESHPQFSKNPGEADLSILERLPTNHLDAKKWLQKFIKERLASYGKYQDAIVEGEQFMFHSGISTFLNFGLLLPTDVLDAVRVAASKVPLASFEGFVRQLIGWREFARLYYTRVGSKEYRKNIFRMKNAALGKYWYDGSAVWMPPIVRNTIKDAFQYGYLHHIRRLMIMSNYMTLMGVHPDRVYQWMYEFALDSWDWVMVFNVYSMGTWSDGGLAMRKPYVSGPSYVQRMAREPKGTSGWVDTWNGLFVAFLQRHRDVLSHTQLAGLVRKHT